MRGIVSAIPLSSHPSHLFGLHHLIRREPAAIVICAGEEEVVVGVSENFKRIRAEALRRAVEGAAPLAEVNGGSRWVSNGQGAVDPKTLCTLHSSKERE